MTSDKYFIDVVRPLITKAELNKRLRPLGLMARGKGCKFGPKKQFVEIYIKDKYYNFIRAVLSGSDYYEDDGMLSVHLYDTWFHRAEIDSDAKKVSESPQDDAEWMLNTIIELCRCAAHYKSIKINEE